MNYYYKYLEALEEIDILESFIFILFCVLVLVVIRNWYNLYKKRNFRKKNRQLKAQLEASQLGIANFDKELQKIASLENALANKHSEIFQLQQEIEDYKQKFFATLSEKDKEIAKQKETNNHQQKAYERYVNYKNVEANNTRLGAHFIKNVISQIYEDLEETEESYKSFLGISYKTNTAKSKLPSLKALKSIFKLLDYNVSALNTEKTSIDDELMHIKMFLDLIKYLKPNTKIELKNRLTEAQLNRIEIKPTLFFPFVENALKHGSLNEEASFISIVLKENTDKQLSYCLVNSAEQRIEQEDKITQTSNFGLNALQQLLNAYYPNSSLEHKTLPNNQYLSELTLSLN
ncbi:LytS family sensor histidine kinase [Winogradskyella schleiferi]|uniref:hypothetical protein n=1 Tax=Winogradskyella schleiferi TaxID=2686078 RepID=UPI0015BDA00A|nr:hypothetical protein [Winogradskyella schleiferi]